MKNFTHITTLFCIVILFSACSGSKSYSKKALKLDEAGLYDESARMYLESLRRNRKNVNAQIGLKSTGQRVLNDQLSAFFKANSMGEKKQAVDSYLTATAFTEQAGVLGVKLDIPSNYENDFQKIKSAYLLDLYLDGQELLKQQQFQEAEDVFAVINSLDASYKDASSLQSVAYLEPLYRSGKELLKQGEFRAAHAELGKVIGRDASYKDAMTLKQDAIEQGRYIIAVLPFKSGPDRSIAARVNAYAITELASTNDPFLKIVDREHIDQILQEQHLGLSGVVDEQTAVNVGNLFGAHAVLIGDVHSYQEFTGKTKRIARKGFESYTVDKVNPETKETYKVTKYKPTTYYEFFQENRAVLSFSYKLVSLETGEVLMSSVVDQERKDAVNYVTYGGKHKLLFPERNGSVYTSNNARRQLQSLLRARTEVVPVSQLGSELVQNSCRGLAGRVQDQVVTRAMQ